MKKQQKSAYERELAKAVHAYNEKIRYHEAKGAKHMPERQSFAELKTMLSTKKDYERTINEIRSFGQKGAETAVRVSEKLIISKWEKQVVEKQVETINRSRRAKRATVAELDVTNSGKPVGYKRGEMSTNRGADLKDKRLNWGAIRSKSELEMYRKTLKEQTLEKYWTKRNERFKLNYIQGLYNTYGSRASAIIDVISKIPAKDVVKKLYEEQNATIDFMYEPLDEDAKLDSLAMIWLEDDTGDIDYNEFFEL